MKIINTLGNERGKGWILNTGKSRGLGEVRGLGLGNTAIASSGRGNNKGKEKEEESHIDWLCVCCVMWWRS